MQEQSASRVHSEGFLVNAKRICATALWPSPSPIASVLKRSVAEIRRSWAKSVAPRSQEDGIILFSQRRRPDRSPEFSLMRVCQVSDEDRHGSFGRRRAVLMDLLMASRVVGVRVSVGCQVCGCEEVITGSPGRSVRPNEAGATRAAYQKAYICGRCAPYGDLSWPSPHFRGVAKLLSPFL